MFLCTLERQIFIDSSHFSFFFLVAFCCGGGVFCCCFCVCVFLGGGGCHLYYSISRFYITGKCSDKVKFLKN